VSVTLLSVGGASSAEWLTGFFIPIQKNAAGFVGYDGRVAVARDDVDHFLKEMLLGRGFPTGQQFDQKDRSEIAATLQAQDRDSRVKLGPVRGFDLSNIDCEFLQYRDILLLRQFYLEVDHEVVC